MPDITCAGNQIPMKVFDGENWYTAIDSVTKQVRLRDVCLDAVVEKSCKEFDDKPCLRTKHFSVLVQPGYLADGNIPLPFKNLKAEQARNVNVDFVPLAVAYKLQSYVDYLSALKVFVPTIDDIFLKKPMRVVPLYNFANAVFSHDEFMMIFGLAGQPGKPACFFGADGDVVPHEFRHGIVYAGERMLGRDMTNLEGSAIHEALADQVGNGNYVTGESLAKCLLGKQASEGIRRLDGDQLQLFEDPECHYRSVSYSTYLTFVGKRLEGIFGGDAAAVAKARDFMQIVTTIMPEYLPASPKRVDFLRAFYNSVLYIIDRPDLMERFKGFNMLRWIAGSDEFKGIIGEGRRYNLFKLGENDYAEVFKKYPFVKDQKVVLDDYAKRGIKLEKIHSTPRQDYYQQVFVSPSGDPDMEVIGAGVKFMKRGDGWQVVESPMSPGTLNSHERMNIAEAWGLLKTKIDPKSLEKILEKPMKFGLVERGEIEEIAAATKHILNKNPPRNTKKVVMSGAVNFEFRIKDGPTYYVNAETGDVRIFRRTFY